MAEIARWTTPAITYKPYAVEAGSISEIIMVIKQAGKTIIRKSIDDAIADEDGFTWALTQEDTAALNNGISAKIKFDFTSNEKRYTTRDFTYCVEDSAVEEVI